MVSAPRDWSVFQGGDGMLIQKIFFCLYVCLFESLAGLLGTMVGPLDNEAHIEQAQA